MIRGIGIDIVRVSRLQRWTDDPALVARFFHPAELQAVAERPEGQALALAARFAAKEAFGKALGTGIRGFRLHEVEVSNDRLGKPVLTLHGAALERFQSSGSSRIHLSLTHETDNAVAVVIIEE